MYQLYKASGLLVRNDMCAASEHISVHMYIRTYICTYVHPYIYLELMAQLYSDLSAFSFSMANYSARSLLGYCTEGLYECFSRHYRLHIYPHRTIFNSSCFLIYHPEDTRKSRVNEFPKIRNGSRWSRITVSRLTVKRSNCLATAPH